MEGSDELQCVGRLEIANTKPVGFLCGTLPVLADAASFRLSQSALVPSTTHTIAAPRYQMLPTETDLNTLPLLPNIPEKVFPAAAAKTSGDLCWESGPISQILSRKCEALAVSGLTEYGDEIDVVAPTDIMKQIFKIPYSKARLSIAVHRIGDTLILNTGPDVEEGEKMFKRQPNQAKGADPSIFLNFAMHSVRAEACDCPPTHYPSSEDQRGSTILPGHFGGREGAFVSSTGPYVGKSQLLDESANDSRKEGLSHYDEYAHGNQDKFFWGTKHKQKQNTKRRNPIKKSSQVGEKPRCPVQESEGCRRVGNNGFLRVLFWQFHNFRILLGSDLLLFSNEKYVAVSLHLWDVARQVTPLTWLEAWLDNVMASVPELAICYHQNGVVQGYELLKTDDIFLLKGISDDGTPAFHPQVVQQNGLSVLRFLQDNCKQDPGAYWLYKSAGEDVIQLFDLSAIPKNHSPDDHDTSCSLSSLMQKGRRDSLFSLGTLLYRIAHRLSLSKLPDNKAKCANFFKKCLDIMGDQDHLVVRAYAHEQFARLILKCYEELDLTSETFLLESEVTVTDVEAESSVFSLGMFGSRAQDKVPSQATEDTHSAADESTLQSSVSDASGVLNVEAKLCMPRNILTSGSKEVEDLKGSTPSSMRKDGLAVCQISTTSPHVVQTVADPISSKLAAIHHISQAIKSLRWKRQLQNTEGDLVDHGSKIPDRSPMYFSLCACGEADCIEVCDIREWLAKSKMDSKLWKLVLLLGESYLVLGEAYKEDGQLDQALKIIELACSVYGSMPQHLEDAQFISSMVSVSSSQQKLENGNGKTDWVVDGPEDLDSSFNEKSLPTDQFSTNYLFWAKAWVLVGDVYVEYHRIKGKDIPVQAEGKKLDCELRMSNEVVREVKRLKKKLGQYKQNCSTCSLINCSCQSDRANSGNSASSSGGDASSLAYGRKQSRKSNTKNSKNLIFARPEDDHIKQKLINTDGCESGNLQNNGDRDEHLHASPSNPDRLEVSFVAADVEEDEGTRKTQCTGSGEKAGFEPYSKDVTEVKHGGIFKFLEGPKIGDVEHNLSAAIGCYDAARKAMDGFPIGSPELHSVVKKKGWVFNELGRYRLDKRDLSSAELAFADAIKAFKEVYDHTNIILINCNLGHGRRALAEEEVSKMEMLNNHGLFQNAYKQAMKSAKLEYIRSLKYYEAAKTELNAVGEGVDSMLWNEVYTQFAHTYLRLGMLLAKEGISIEVYGKPDLEELSIGDDLISSEGAKEQIKHEMSANDAFREALAIYESLGELRKQEAAFAHFQLACYHRDSCLKFLDVDHKQIKLSKCENNNRQKAKWYASLAERNWQKSLDFYGPKTHSVMYLTILLEQSALCSSLSGSFNSNMMLESALCHLLDGRHVVGEASEDFTCNPDSGTEEKFWNQLQALLKRMLGVAVSGNPNKSGPAASAVAANRVGDVAKLKEMYRISLKSTSLGQLHVMYNLWIS